jgi:protein-L-isoaspartate(D-aspartate) O-methyltransferase
MFEANHVPRSPIQKKPAGLPAGAAIPERRVPSATHLRIAALALVALVSLHRVAHAAPAAEDNLAAARARMLTVIRANAEAVGSAAGPASISQRVLDVMARVPRHEFVPDDLRGSAYDDRPLPIGFGQTISQPYIVALMTDLLRVEPADTVLEVGTGSGYQAAVLSPLAARVFSIEIVPQLAEAAKARLVRLHYDNVAVRAGDGYYGWQEAAPFDGIVVTAAASHIPPPLIQQLRPGGRMVIPVGGPFFVQHLMLVEKREDGTVTSRQLLPVRFVPLTGGR